jgi:hypothetical protein
LLQVVSADDAIWNKFRPASVQRALGVAGAMRGHDEGQIERAYFRYLDLKAKVLLAVAAVVVVLLVISLFTGGIRT